MQKFEKNIPNRLNKLKKRPKCLSCNYRNKKTSNLMSFQFKSSLFTEKNRTLIEKLVSQSVSPDNSFSKEIKSEKKKNKDKDKEKNNVNKYPTTTKAKNMAICHRIYKKTVFQNMDGCKKKIFCKKTLNHHINSTFSSMAIECINRKKNNIKKSINCQIHPIKKRNVKIKISNNNSVEKKKIEFNNGLVNNKHKKTRNNSVKIKLNFNSSVKSVYERKKCNGSIIKNLKYNYNNIRHSTHNQNNINIITVNTIDLKNRKKKIKKKILEDKNKPKNIVGQKYKNAFNQH
jgi:hypothetical protein